MEFGSPAYWAAVASGAISWMQAADDNASRQVRSDRAKTAPRRRAPTKRELRPAPTPSRQYAAVSTSPARDERLTGTALRLLVLLVAIAGRGDGIHTTKAGLAGALGRHAKSIQKALGLLERLGYITRSVWRHANGLNRGLVVIVTDAARPFWHPMGAATLPLLNQGLNRRSNDADRNHSHRHDQGRIGQNDTDGNACGGGGAWRGACHSIGHRPEPQLEPSGR